MASHAKSIFEKSSQGVETFLDSNHSHKKVVVTHHGPSEKSIHENYFGSPLNGCFASALVESFEKRSVPLPDLWLHGHTHASISHNFSGGCRMLANPAGYPDFSGTGFSLENKNFNELLLIDL